jgi:hypothetical protein
MQSRKLARLRRLMDQAATLKSAPQEAIRPTLGIPLQAGRMDAITRDAYLRRIRFLRDRHNLRWLVDEASGYVTALECLEDHELVRVQAALERARECIAEDIPMEDADLVPVSWADTENCVNHVSLTPLGGQNCANHVSAPAEPDFVFVPWHRLPQNAF